MMSALVDGSVAELRAERKILKKRGKCYRSVLGLVVRCAGPIELPGL